MHFSRIWPIWTPGDRIPVCPRSGRWDVVEARECRLMVVSPSASSMFLVLLYLACIGIPAEVRVSCDWVAPRCLASRRQFRNQGTDRHSWCSLPASSREASDSSSCLARPNPLPWICTLHAKLVRQRGNSMCFLFGRSVSEQLPKGLGLSDLFCSSICTSCLTVWRRQHLTIAERLLQTLKNSNLSEGHGTYFLPITHSLSHLD